jgi:non-heme chloroperoxidase
MVIGRGKSSTDICFVINLKPLTMKMIIVLCSIFSASAFSHLTAQLSIVEQDHYIIWENQAPTPDVKSIKLSNGLSLQYAEQGEVTGVPVIFLHGLTDSWISFQSVMNHLPKEIHAFAISQRGHGDSDKPATGYTTKVFSDDVAVFIKDKKLGSAIVVGHSMGGAVAQQFAVDHPSLCKGVVIVSSDAWFNDNPGFTEFTRLVSALSDPVDPAFANEFQKSTLLKPIDDAYYSRLVAESLKVPARVWKDAIQGLSNADLRPSLKSIKSPVMICWGDKDGICFRSDQELMVKEIPNSTLVIYKETGHALHWEHPARFAADLINFIDKYK